MKRLSLILLLVSCLLLMAGGAFAQDTDIVNLTVNATVSARAKLTLGESAINFVDADPDSGPIAATENPVSVRAQVRTGAASLATLTCLSGGNLVSGGDSIPIANVTWTATGTGYVAGTMSSTLAQSAGSWTGSGDYTGTFSYSLANSWDYEIGTYQATVAYTLTAP